MKFLLYLGFEPWPSLNLLYYLLYFPIQSKLLRFCVELFLFPFLLAYESELKEKRHPRRQNLYKKDHL